ncbi:N-6 DNA methylase [Phormidium sp. FACHB-1136]|uniref:N-6 DNA methylase n=1 Tax=Phormidium sp. FACHB-1136 TaxID=2692848 RepID=UPI0018EF5F83|nr:N-6 DNA methylase [Phormidium sp. FACHB-1136]
MPSAYCPNLPAGCYSTAILLFTKVWGPKDKINQPATEQVWFYEMQQDGYSLDDKRTKQEGYGDLQDIVTKYQTRNPKIHTDRTQKCFFVSRKDIEAEDYDLSLSRYKEDVFEEVNYEAPGVILDRLLQAEVGEIGDEDLTKVTTGIVRELLDLRELIG